MKSRCRLTPNRDLRLEPMGSWRRPASSRSPSLLFAFLAGALLCLPAAAAGELSPGTLELHSPLRLPDLDGRELDLRELRGKVVLVNFWASWCTPCIEEMPSIQRLANALRNRPFAVIGVNVGEGELRARAVVQQLGIRFPVLIDKDSAAFQRWGARVLPTTYVQDGEGIIRYLGLGPLEWDSVELVDLLTRIAAGESKVESE